MGLKLRYSLFYGVQPAAIYHAYKRFWAAIGHPLRDLHNASAHPSSDLSSAWDLYEPNNGWTILSWNIGWEYEIRRQAQMVASVTLGCPGFFVFVFDDSFWGYELFRYGVALDYFVQDPDPSMLLFHPSCDCHGHPERLVKEFPWLRSEDVAPYLIQKPNLSAPFEEYDRLNILVQPGDEFTRFAECSILNFLRLLGVAVELRDHYVTLLTPIYRSFELTGWDTFPTKRFLIKPH